MISIDPFNAFLVTPREDENLKFKEARQTFATPKIFEYCVAIANEGGGNLILAVTDASPRKVVGTDAISDTDHVATQIFTKRPPASSR